MLKCYNWTLLMNFFKMSSWISWTSKILGWLPDSRRLPRWLQSDYIIILRWIIRNYNWHPGITKPSYGSEYFVDSPSRNQLSTLAIHVKLTWKTHVIQMISRWGMYKLNYLTHSIWQIRPLFTRLKWNKGEILAFLA